MTFEEKTLLLTARRLPARLTTGQLAILLGIHEDAVGLLVRHRLLKALGHPEKNAPKFFMSAEWDKLRQDARWLSRISDVIATRCRGTND